MAVNTKKTYRPKSKAIQHAMVDADMEKQEVAKAIGKSPAFMTYVMSEILVKKEEAEAIASVLGKRVSDLFEKV